MQKERLKKYAKFFLKLAVTAWAISIIIKAADVPKIWEYLHTASPLNIIAAFIVLNTGQIISSLRMRYYFAANGLKLPYKYAVLLYFVGNLFNLVLPGGIGGDGYKAYIAKKYGKISVITGVRVMISNRANGLLLLILITSALSLFSSRITSMPYIYLGLAALVFLTVISYSFIAYYFLKEPVKIQLGATFYSVFVQLFVALTVFFLLLGRGVAGNMIDYIILFMISSIITIIPISIGGVGLRELTFFKGAPLLGLDPELGIAICIIYFIINSISSLVGLLFLHKLKEISHGRT